MRGRNPKIPRFSAIRNGNFEINENLPGELTIPFLQQKHRQQPSTRYLKPTQMRLREQVEEPEVAQIITTFKKRPLIHSSTLYQIDNAEPVMWKISSCRHF